MFTGIIEERGVIARRDGGPEEVRLKVEIGWDEVPGRGESIAVDGVCLTVVAAGAGWFEALVSPETIGRTTLGERAPGDRVNLERALRLGDRLGGHIVQGHVDAVGRVAEVLPEGSGARMRLAFPGDLRPYIAMKGSIAVDGVSLTVAALGAGTFDVALIPETLSRTGLGSRRAGDAVNLEVDVLGRYVVEALRARDVAGGASPVTREMLVSHGFVVEEVVP
jgi:riboflavin synthase